MQNWNAKAAPDGRELAGRYARLSLIDFESDIEPLFEAIVGRDDADLWQYIPMPVPKSPEELRHALIFVRENIGWETQIIRSQADSNVLGMASFMRIRPEHGSAEVGCVIFSKELQRTPIATEAIYLMGKHLFDDLGYRRFEWKCNNANVASKRAAIRFGFTFEGIFRNDMVVKGENRDTAWYSMIDNEWAQIKAGFDRWLSPTNFDDAGQQRHRLIALRDDKLP